MNRLLRTLLFVLLGAAVALPALLFGQNNSAETAADAQRPELAYLKQVNRWRPPSDPQLIFLLMSQFANANRRAEGIAYFEAVRRELAPQLDDVHKALYMVATASLRAGHANDVFLPRRIVWVRDTLAMLDEAKRMTRGEMFVARWMSGIVRAQLPGFFGERDTAVADLRWCIAHIDKAPHPGWLRETYFHLAKLERDAGNAAEAQRLQTLSGYAAGAKPVIFTTPFGGDTPTGQKFAARKIDEPVPGIVYRVSGFEFTEYYFIVSADRRELIAIDAGTRADAAREAHEALRERVPSLPPITTVLVTHAHWDHVGGQAYFRSLTPAVRFYARSNYADELARGAKSNAPIQRRFFGTRFRLDDVLAFRPDVLVDRPTELRIGGTRVALLPTRGGETDDAMLVHLPELGVVFVGDVLMPYLGAPFVEEGSVDGLLQAIEQLSQLKPRLLLHGHAPLTQVFPDVEMLNDLRAQLVWLREAVLREMAGGAERGAIHQANLMPPALERSPSPVHLAYLVLRGNVIDRLFDQNSGYWQNGLQGLDALTEADRGAVLVDYLGAGESQIASAVDRMMHDGRHELAAATLRQVRTRLPASERLAALSRNVYLRLMEKSQDIDPFRFFVYGAQIDLNTAQFSAPKPPQDAE